LKIFLSYILDINTPSYGNRKSFQITKDSNIDNGDLANDSSICTTVHMGTHIDMPFHFYKNGQTIEYYDAKFWEFNKVLFLENTFVELLIEKELIDLLNSVEDIGYEFLIVKTGMCNIRKEDKYWKSNYGFSPKIAEYLKIKFPNIRVFGFDTISVTSFQHREIGKIAHKVFLNPDKAILLLEDMDLRQLSINSRIQKVIIAPLRIANCDGLPCTVIGEVN
jgi:arylformamidase